MPVRPVRGRGSWLIDEDGHEWLDAYGGHAVASTGHSHPDVVRAIAEQAARAPLLLHRRPLPQREALAEKLAELLSRAAGSGLPLQLGGGGQRERAASGAPAHRSADDRLASAAVGTAAPPRRSPAPTARATRRRPGARACRSAGRCRSTMSPRSTGSRRRCRRGAGRAGPGVRRRARLLARVPPGRPPALRRARRGAALRRGAVRRRPLRRVQRGRGGGSDARRADLRQGTGRRTSHRRGGRDARGSPTRSRSATWAAPSAAGRCPAPRRSPTSA